MNLKEIQVLRLIHDHQHVVGTELGDHRCSCGGWDWRTDGQPQSHGAHLAQVVVETVCDATWLEGFAHGYESPNMEIDFKPLSPYSADRTPFDYQWPDVSVE